MAQPVPPPAEVPLAMPAGLGDPARAAVLAATPAFADTTTLAGRPAEAARQAARLEWLAATLVHLPEWRRASPLLGLFLIQGRDELRGALGIPSAAAPAAVAGALLDAAAALEAGEPARAAAALDAVGQGGSMLARLATLPPLPHAARATALAQSELTGDGRWDVD
ncbi:MULTISPECIES: hypothetical protein [Roseomonadaceae]|uniref:Uncharacterized protein n=1 Tax=Falsiroseomonas oleicola TaxID=2801474 RepID=A0ABS6H470_9PROT|nr:hypothetical protein [Roseomonas oleicola]MBU8543466.1 hypothetical protein [Roseomonas oleicola]